MNTYFTSGSWDSQIKIEVWISVADPGCLSRILMFSIPDPGSEFFPSRIPGPHQRVWVFEPQKMISKLSKIRSGFFILDPDPDFLPIPDPRSRGRKGTGSRIRTTSEQHVGNKLSPQLCIAQHCGAGMTVQETEAANIFPRSCNARSWLSLPLPSLRTWFGGSGVRFQNSNVVSKSRKPLTGIPCTIKAHLPQVSLRPYVREKKEHVATVCYCTEIS